MNTHLQNGKGPNKHITSEIAAGMLRALDRRYRRLFEAAQREWERNYAGPDPTDACVNVRVSGAEPSVLGNARHPGRVSLAQTSVASAIS